MKHQPKTQSLQLRFALLDVAPMELPSDKQSDLMDALGELLLQAAGDSMMVQGRGGDDESEIDL